MDTNAVSLPFLYFLCAVGSHFLARRYSLTAPVLPPICVLWCPVFIPVYLFPLGSGCICFDLSMIVTDLLQNSSGAEHYFQYPVIWFWIFITRFSSTPPKNFRSFEKSFYFFFALFSPPNFLPVFSAFSSCTEYLFLIYLDMRNAASWGASFDFGLPC